MNLKSSFIAIFFLLIFCNIKAQYMTNFTTDNVLPSNSTTCAVEDQNGNMWFGTQAGVVRFDGTSWITIDKSSHPSLIDNSITAIEVDNDNNIWVGTDFGISIYDGTSFTSYTKNDGLGNNRIRHLFTASTGDVWISDFNGATVYDGSAFNIFSTTDGLPFGGVNYTTEDVNGTIWLGTGLGGAIQYDGSSFTSITDSSGLINNAVSAIAIDEVNNKWIGTGAGISVLNDTNKNILNFTKFFTLPPPDTLNPVEDIKIDSTGNIWVGVYVDYLVTEGGVAVYDGTQWENYDVSDGLVSPVVKKLWVDSRDYVWVTTGGGITAFSSQPISIVTSNLETQKTNSSFSIYPNPTNNNAYVTTPSMKGFVEVLDMNLSRLELIEVISSKTKVNLEGFPKGIYFVRVGNTISKLILN